MALSRNLLLVATVALLCQGTVAQSGPCADCDFGQSDSVSGYCIGGSCTNCGSCGIGSLNGGRYCWCGSNDDLCEQCPN